MRDFQEKHGEGWYEKWQTEMRLIESYAFNNTEWACGLWARMAECEGDAFGFVETPGVERDVLMADICRVFERKKVVNIGPSADFSPEFITLFVDNAADEFVEFLKELI